MDQVGEHVQWEHVQVKTSFRGLTEPRFATKIPGRRPYFNHGRTMWIRLKAAFVSGASSGHELSTDHKQVCLTRR